MVVFSLGLPRIYTFISSFNFKKFQYVGSQSHLSRASVHPDTVHLDRAPKPPAWHVVRIVRSIPEGYASSSTSHG